MNDEFTYVYSHSLNGKIFYIGVGSKIRTSYLSRRNEKWHDFVKDSREDVVVDIMLKTRSRKEAFSYEKEMIIKHKPYANYYDGTPSGNKHPMYGKNHTTESRDKMRKSKIGTTHSSDAKLKMSQSHVGDKNGMYCKNHSIETRDKMRKNRKNMTRVEINDGEKSFIVQSMAEASRITGIKHSTIKNQTKNGKMCVKDNITIKRIGDLIKCK